MTIFAAVINTASPPVVTDIFELEVGEVAADYGAIECSDAVRIGWEYTSGTFSAPAFESSAEPATPTVGEIVASASDPAVARAALEVLYSGVAPNPVVALGMSADFNQDFASGFYTIGGDWSNGPAGASPATCLGTMLVIQRNGQGIRQTQIYSANDGAPVWFRTGSNLSTTPAWTTWRKITTSAGGTFDGLIDAAAGLKIGTGVTIVKVLSATATLDFPSIAAAASSSLTITVTGAAVGDTVALGLPATPAAGLVFTSTVSATNTVTIKATNVTASAVDAASATYRATVFRI